MAILRCQECQGKRDGKILLPGGFNQKNINLESIRIVHSTHLDAVKRSTIVARGKKIMGSLINSGMGNCDVTFSSVLNKIQMETNERRS